MVRMMELVDKDIKRGCVIMLNVFKYLKGNKPNKDRNRIVKQKIYRTKNM